MSPQSQAGPEVRTCAGGPTPAQEPLAAALVEIEHYVGASGWDQPARLFALAPTAQLLEAGPALADRLAVTGPGQLSPIEQDDFHPGQDVLSGLAAIAWPSTVAGCAVCTERSFLPAGVEADIPGDPAGAADYVAAHPAREDIRVVMGALRDGTTYGVARLASHPGELLAGDELVPALSGALVRTFEWEEPDQA
ncbi:PPA1309 family protein [uncultured Propionibacterium sp.]|uniref:PPA1309 family protein n=1 Tax=uncultured Propionibacterium sp. TaxID=218066 RepID=UPI00292E2CE8|nr:PPA1309 family protein [uncultured Propionibacterium sp.]